MGGEVIVICGPTASGKTALAVELAKCIGAEIVSADSMQIYKEMNIGTAKPNMAERGGIAHHMLDVVSVTEEYNTPKYVEAATECIEDIISRKKRVILAGGTGLYIDSLINNVNFFEIENDYEYRNSLCRLAAENGNLHVHEILREIDPKSAERIHPNDLKRTVRALEVYKVTGKTMTQVQLESVRERRYTPRFIGLDYQSRENLYDRINRRAEGMMRDGLADEARPLLRLTLSSTAKAAIGYHEAFEYIDGKMTYDGAVASIAQKTRNYAKRQLTWFRKNREINWLYPDLLGYDIGRMTEAALKLTDTEV